jgi:hypothetical protein
MGHSDRRLKAPKNMCTLQVDIITSPEELAKGGECYKTLKKKLILPFQPFVGLRIAIDPVVSEADETKYLLLSKNINNHFGFFNVESITYHVERSEFRLYARNFFEPNLKSFYDSQDFYVSFFGFRRLY